MKEFFKENFKVLIFVGVAVVVFPVILILFFTNRSPFDSVYGSNDAWIGFWGSYAGGLMTAAASGGLAYYISKKEAELTKREEKRRRVNAFKSQMLIKEFENLKNDILSIVGVISNYESKLNSFIRLVEEFIQSDYDLSKANEINDYIVVLDEDKQKVKNKMDMIKNIRLPALTAGKPVSFYSEIMNPLKEALCIYLNFPEFVKSNFTIPYAKEHYDFENFLPKEHRDNIESKRVKIRNSASNNLPKELENIKNGKNNFEDFKRKMNSKLDKQLEILVNEYFD